jgi:hypothetical protein
MRIRRSRASCWAGCLDLSLSGLRQPRPAPICWRCLITQRTVCL